MAFVFEKGRVQRETSQTGVGLLWSRGWRIVEGGREVVVVLIMSAAVEADGIIEVRPPRVAVVDHD